MEQQNMMPQTAMIQPVGEEEVEIDLLELLYAIKQHILSVVITGLLGALIGLSISMFAIAPTYSSGSMLLVLTKETTLASLADIQMGSQLTNDYQVLITSRPVLEQVIFNLNLDMNYQSLKGKISINNPSNTRIIEIRVQDNDPVRAMDIVNELSRIASEFIGDKMEVIPPKIIEEGVVSRKSTGPNHKANFMIGLVIGAGLNCVLICFGAIMDDSIKSEEDVQRFLEIPVLASVPDRKDFINEGNTKGRGGKGRSILDRLKKRLKKTRSRKKEERSEKAGPSEETAEALARTETTAVGDDDGVKSAGDGAGGAISAGDDAGAAISSGDDAGGVQSGKKAGTAPSGKKKSKKTRR